MSFEEICSVLNCPSEYLNAASLMQAFKLWGAPSRDLVRWINENDDPGVNWDTAMQYVSDNLDQYA